MQVLGLFPVWCKDEPLRSRCRMGFAQVSRTVRHAPLAERSARKTVSGYPCSLCVQLSAQGFSVFDSCECLKEAAWSVTWVRE